MVAMAKNKGKLNYAGARLARWRFWVQGGFLLVWLDPLLLHMHQVCGPVFHCYSCPLATFACPIGVLANFSALHVWPLVALGMLTVVGTLLGSFVCGWICPFGFLQDLLGRIPTPKLTLPAWLGYCRYLVLAGMVLAIPYWYGESHPLFICSLCPAGALETSLPNMARQAMAGEQIGWPSIWKIAVLVTVLLGAVFTWRPWCTMLCPLGAIYGLFNHVSLVFVGFQAQQCTDCDLCRGACRYRGSSQRRASDTRCVRCLECFRCRALGVGTVFGDSGKLVSLSPSERGTGQAADGSAPGDGTAS
jgi:ferredoxin-type protein NapH